jgi:hypothetical protein
VTQQVGGAIGLALITAVATTGQVNSNATSITSLDNCFQSTVLVAAAIATIGFAVAAVTLPGRGSRRGD